MPSDPIDRRDLDAFIRLCVLPDITSGAKTPDEILADTNSAIEVLLPSRCNGQGLPDGCVPPGRPERPAHRLVARRGGAQRTAVAGKRLAVTVVAAHDPEKRPLVVVTLEDGTPLNARLIQQGLARPWKTPGPWQSWVVHDPPVPTQQPSASSREIE